jgi:hypothetical protein
VLGRIAIKVNRQLSRYSEEVEWAEVFSAMQHHAMKCGTHEIIMIRTSRGAGISNAPNHPLPSSTKRRQNPREENTNTNKTIQSNHMKLYCKLAETLLVVVQASEEIGCILIAVVTGSSEGGCGFGCQG